MTDGLFNAMLGAVTPLRANVFSSPAYVQVAVGGTPLESRMPLGTVPYAFRAEKVDTVEGFHAAELAAAGETPSFTMMELTGQPSGITWYTATGGTQKFPVTITKPGMLMVTTTGYFLSLVGGFGDAMSAGIGFNQNAAAPNNPTNGHMAVWNISLGTAGVGMNVPFSITGCFPVTPGTYYILPLAASSSNAAGTRRVYFSNIVTLYVPGTM